MKLTRYTDYAMRVMIHLASHDGELSSIRQIAGVFDISQNHLMKVVQDLAAAGFVKAIRGRRGGLRLARPANEINLGKLLRHTEALTDLLDCSSCIIAPACALPPILTEATAAFVAVFDKYTVADLVDRRNQLRAMFSSEWKKDRAINPETAPP